MNYLIAFFATAIISVVATIIVRKMAIKLNLIDQPDRERAIHTRPIPLMGGLAVFISFILVISYYAFFTDQLVTGYLHAAQLYGIVIGGLILMVGGYYDDRFRLKPSRSIIAPILAAIVVIAFGLIITGVTNPLGGTIHFDKFAGEFDQPIVFYLMKLFSLAITFVWLMGMMYTTKILDGMDGLVTGIGLIAALIISAVAIGPTLQQGYIALLAIIFAGALAGFLIFNFNPASIFIGEGGSLFVGFVLGSLAIISGSKIATTLLVMGIPILDVVWVLGRRLATGQKTVSGDKLHLHHRLLALGLSQRQAALLLYLLTIMFGAMAIFLQTYYKIYALVILVIFMVSFGLLLVYLYKKRQLTKF